MSDSEDSTPPDDNSEWEYEYDQNETEDFYVTLDMTYYPLRHAKPDDLLGIVSRDSRTQEANNENDNERNNNEDSAAVEDGVAKADPYGIQILDLHSTNPLVQQGGRIFSCRWAHTVGTDLFFSKRPEEDKLEEHNPMRPFEMGSFDLLASSSIKLIPTEVKLRRRASADNSNLELYPPHMMAGRRMKGRQESFLDRLTAIKAEKGEPDSVRLGPSTDNGVWFGTFAVDEDNADLHVALAGQDIPDLPFRGDMSDEEPLDQEHDQRPRRKRARIGRVVHGEPPGFERGSGNISVPTPRTWDELEQHRVYTSPHALYGTNMGPTENESEAEVAGDGEEDAEYGDEDDATEGDPKDGAEEDVEDESGDEIEE
ncbi:hypothetical protein BDY21DRAFT_344214 [Lineolata rhizophorae]|uniref:Transcription factor TFIIIC triple barrel domain-containing protein n=1 Tax=Lineolata rhizophorae TaxID=578093 RepID=A0A6A6P182_9PEZI|nr:hypothetical protein BDY21DRAFT_344214 [Lineolata rhizophorae]